MASRALHDTSNDFVKLQFEQSPKGQHHNVLIKLLEWKMGDYVDVFKTLKKFMECIDNGTMTLGFVLTVTGWILTKDSKQRSNTHAIIHVAACDMRTLVCASAMLGHHVPHIEAVE